MDDQLDLNVYSPESLLAQAETAPLKLGYQMLMFYTNEDGTLAKEKSPTTSIFYLSPSGGTLRDSEMNIVVYSAKFDRYKGYGRKAST